MTIYPPIRIFVNKLENRTTFKTKTGYYLEIVTLEMVKLLGSTKSKITEDENGEHVTHLEITELVLVHFNIINNEYQQDLKSSIHSFPIIHLVNY